jgi:hypothetical protein
MIFPSIVPNLAVIELSSSLIESIEVFGCIVRQEDALLRLELISMALSSDNLTEQSDSCSASRMVFFRHLNRTKVLSLKLGPW